MSFELFLYFGNSRNIDFQDAIKALSALGQQTRLAVFRLLISAGPSGLPAGEIARRLQIAPSTLSTHLGQMEAAGLVRATRLDRRIIYAVEIVGVRRLLTFLTEDCCQGRPELCGGLIANTEPESTESTA